MPKLEMKNLLPSNQWLARQPPQTPDAAFATGIPEPLFFAKIWARTGSVKNKRWKINALRRAKFGLRGSDLA
ncbi:MAG: hypothetical protein E2591_18005 [Achromobacter sp.]|uniref:hypothetical protein n=1 Tax=Achromobacter sp. TaxID=134375 RepID=UPI0012C34EDE|nr:hypothetical protein [Achromobacter sp.]MPS79964.1 hypothetical protein [Achromobacter sp.]